MAFMIRSKIVFWFHFLIVTAAHLAAIALPISLIWFILALDATWQLKTTISCVSFFVSVLGINHVTSKDSVCVLTTLENYYRNKENKASAGEYIPRYYDIIRKVFSSK
jgi:hypothetical protein